MHILDAFMVLMVLGICAFWCQQLVEAMYDYIDGASPIAIVAVTRQCVLTISVQLVRSIAAIFECRLLTVCIIMSILGLTVFFKFVILMCREYSGGHI